MSLLTNLLLATVGGIFVSWFGGVTVGAVYAFTTFYFLQTTDKIKELKDEVTENGNKLDRYDNRSRVRKRKRRNTHSKH